MYLDHVFAITYTLGREMNQRLECIPLRCSEFLSTTMQYAVAAESDSGNQGFGRLDNAKCDPKKVVAAQRSPVSKSQFGMPSYECSIEFL